MPVSKVNSNYRVTIPKEVRERAKISKGDSVQVEHDEKQSAVTIRPPARGKRKTLRLGAPLSPKDIERAIERGR